MRILLTDDTLDTLTLFRMIFEAHGFSVETACDGIDAVQAVQQEQPFDAILLDLEMPRLSGWDALREIRQMPQGKQAVILVFTAYVDDAKRDQAKLAGADDLFFKPMLPEKLVLAVKDAIKRRQNSKINAQTEI